MVIEKSNSKVDRKSRKKQIIKEAIINYAEKEFFEKGFANTKVDDIALNSGTAKATLYKYFNSKEDLLASVCSKSYLLYIDILEKELQSTDKVNQFRSVINSYKSFNNLYSGHFNILISPEALFLNNKIYTKIANNEPLNESEEEYRSSEEKLTLLFSNVFSNFLNSSNMNSDLSITMSRVLIYFTFTIKEIISRSALTNRSSSETDEILEITAFIIENGLIHYLNSRGTGK